ncbi:MAG TPA: hypothetical protein DD426_11600 [Clostridiaceae bacterium]|nr:hypothetical protein [Clostridiaceae bacterium]
MGDKLSLGIAIAIICIVLIGFSYIIKLQHVIIDIMNKSKKVNDAKVDQVAWKDEDDDEQLVAVISAAVASYLGRSVSDIIVKTIKRVEPQVPSWAKAGRQDVMSSRF